MSARRSVTGHGFDHRLEQLPDLSPAPCSAMVSVGKRCSDPAVVVAACSFTTRSGHASEHRRNLCDRHAQVFCHLHHIDRAALKELAATAQLLPATSSATQELAPPVVASLPNSAAAGGLQRRG